MTKLLWTDQSDSIDNSRTVEVPARWQKSSLVQSDEQPSPQLKHAIVTDVGGNLESLRFLVNGRNPFSTSKLFISILIHDDLLVEDLHQETGVCLAQKALIILGHVSVT